MFSWICPKCGSEVPPSYNECPNCTATAVAPPPGQASTRPAAPPPPPPPPQARAPWPQQQQPTYQQPAPPPQESRRPPKPAGVLFGPGGGDYDPASAPPPPNYPPPPQQYQNYPPQGFVPQQSYTPPPPPAYAPPPQAQPSYAPPPQSSGMPSWMLMLLVALVVGGVVAGAVWLKRRSADSTDAVAQGAPVTGESTPSAASAGHRYAKFVELSGFRISEDAKQRASVKLAVTNHSTADIGDIEMVVTLKTTDGRDLGTATMKASGLGPLTTAEVTAPLKTKLRAYELPDWQFVKAEFQITSQ